MHRQDARSPVHPAIAPIALVLVLPAMVFLAAATLRLLQPVQHQPAATADAIFHGFAAFPRPLGIALVLLIGPLVAFVLAGVDQWLRWRHDDAWRAALLALAAASGRVIATPLAVISALALLGSALWLALVVVHGIAG